MLKRPLVLILLLALPSACPSIVFAEKPAPDLKAGKAAYLQSCARCHGTDGKGDGLDAKRFYPRPRDLALGVYKFRSTASGTPPTDEDLFETITRGLPGSNMPDWRHLDEATRWQLVYYLKSLSPVFEQSTPEPLALAPDPGPARADLTKGRALYTQLGCAACHGAQGRANGPSATGLVDDWGKPIRPANLTAGWSYRGGGEPRDVMRRVLTGIDGAGMPSYTGAVSPEDAWHLAYYVASLQEPPRWNRIAYATEVRGELPTAWDDPHWETAQRIDVRLRNAVTAEGEWTEPPTVSALGVAVLYNEASVAFRLTWDDPSNETQQPADALALVLKPAGVKGDVVTLQAWPYDGAPRLDLVHWTAEGSVEAYETVAADFHQIPPGSQPAPVSSTAAYEDGRWRLILVRPLAPGLPAEAATLHPEEFASIAFAVWDGANPGARAVSPWMDVAWAQQTEH